MWINQDSVFSMGLFDSGTQVSYNLKHPGNGAYVFIIDGKVEVDGSVLEKRDAAGVYNTDNFDISVSQNAKILVIEVPLE